MASFDRIFGVGRVVIIVALVALTLYALVDCIRTPSDSTPGKLPKFLWLLLILLITPIGPIAWIIVARVAAAEAKGGRFEPTVWSSQESLPLSFGREKPAEAPQTPDDDPAFLEEVSRRLRDKQREEYQRKKRAEQESSPQDKPRKQDPPGADDSGEETDSSAY